MKSILFLCKLLGFSSWLNRNPAQNESALLFLTHIYHLWYKQILKNKMNYEKCITQRGSLAFQISVPIKLTFLYRMSPCEIKKWQAFGMPGWVSRLSHRLLISAQVMISECVGLSPTSGSALIARNLLGILCLYPFLSAPPLPAPMCSRSLSK